MTTLASDSLVLARRRLAHIRLMPEKLLDVTLQPLMFVLLFSFVFGGAIHVTGGGYREYLIGGVLVQTLSFGLVGPAMSMATDIKEGILDRFRSLPMSRSAFLYGHLVAESLAAGLAMVIMVTSGLVVGWRIHTDFAHAVAAFGLLALIALVFVWLGTLLGVIVRSPDAVMGVAFVVIFPLTFVANAFVPVGGLPDGLRAVAEWNPISAMVAGVRTLFGNPTALPADGPWPLHHPVLSSVLYCLALLAVAIPLTMQRYRARTEG
ncbi:MAG TPA: ABC transporter permease [Thermoleophilaceae bacterium]|jgi:ABC transporter DrrB family efflux protein